MSMPPGPPQPPGQQPPDPHQPPASPYPPAPPVPPGGYGTPPPGSFGAPPPGAGYPGGIADPLTLPPGSPFGEWINKVVEVTKRSWKSALIITTIGIAAPRALVSLIEVLLGVSGFIGGASITRLGGFGASVLLGFLVTFVFAAAASFVAAAGWAAGTWALVQEAATGTPANLQDAFRYGLRRAANLWLWTLLVAVLVTVGFCFCYLPGIYLGFGLSMFGFVVVFERGQNPIARSFKLTHANIGPTLGRVAVLGAASLAYTAVIGVIFGAIGVAVGLGLGAASSFGYRFGVGLLTAIGALLSAPAYALGLLGLLPTYAELRAQEGSLVGTGQLQHELNN